MKNLKELNWIPNAGEIVGWGCEAVKVVSVNMGGKAIVKSLDPNKNGRIIKNIDVSQLHLIA